MRKLKFKKAFTLIELLISAGVFALVAGTILTVMMTGLSSWQIGEAKTQGQQDARRALQTMTREIRLTNPSGHLEILNDSGQTISTGVGTEIRFQVPLYSDHQIQLESSGYKQWGANYGGQSYKNYWISYKLIKQQGKNTGQLKRIILSTNKALEIQSSVLADNLRDVNFIGLPNNTFSPTSVQIILVITNVSNTKSVNSVLKSRVWLRNRS